MSLHSKNQPKIIARQFYSRPYSSKLFFFLSIRLDYRKILCRAKNLGSNWRCRKKDVFERLTFFFGPIITRSVCGKIKSCSKNSAAEQNYYFFLLLFLPFAHLNSTILGKYAVVTSWQIKHYVWCFCCCCCNFYGENLK